MPESGSAGGQPSVEEVLRCDLCGSADATHLLETRDRLFNLPGQFSLLRCADCKLVRLSPRPDRSSLSGYYPKDAYGPHQARRGAVPTRRLSSVRDSLRTAGLSARGYLAPDAPWWVRPLGRALPPFLVRRAAYGRILFPAHLPGGRALDVGCGNGAFLDVLRRHGWDIAGVDASEAAAAAAQSAYGINVHVGELQSAPLEPASFDFVNLSHVIEHVWSPRQTLTRVAELLTPTGQLYIETPNVESFGFRRCGPYWYPLETPRHLWLFSMETLTRALEAAGLEVLRTGGRLFPSFSWEATYRQEEAVGHLLASRPYIPARARSRALVLGTTNAVLARLRPATADIVYCCARRRENCS
jgi:2-polyprenyl-3-methyl-5-hydroxy-6-metoxy-1,4-benzoquinol methylase